MSSLVPLPIVLPLLGAALSIGLGRSRNAQRVVGVGTLSIATVVTGVLLAQVDERGIQAVQGGGWGAPVGITLVADRLSAFILVAAMVTLLAVLIYAIGQPGTEERHVGFHPAYLILASGIAASLLTGDLFNLFVAFEVMLMASYVLITLGGRPGQVRSGMTYVVISLIASTLFLFSLALVYAATGTLNMADLHGKIAGLPSGLRTALALLLVVVFGIKAAIFPLFFWLPDSYPTAAAPVTAVFAGLLTKVGVYAMIRTQTLLFPPDSRPGTLLLVVAGLTMVIGVFGAISQNDIKRLLSFHIISQIGYMILGLGLFTVAGVAGAVLFIVHQIVVKTTLFMIAGLIEERTGTDELSKLSGLRRLEPALAVLFLLAAFSLAGIPPLSGFVAKLALVDAGLSTGEYVIVGVSLAVSLLTLYSMVKIWSNGFWGPVPEQPLRNLVSVPRHALMVGSTGALVAVSLLIAAAAGPLWNLSDRAAQDVMNPRRYVTEVLGR